MPRKVFISWSGGQGKALALALAESVINPSLAKFLSSEIRLEPWVSSRDIGAGRSWFAEIVRATEQAQFAIAILTKGSSVRPWVNFEAGCLYGKLGVFKLLQMGEAIEVEGPLAQLQTVDGTTKDGIKKLMDDMVSDSEEWTKHVYSAWKNRFTVILQQKDRSPHERLESHLRYLSNAADRFADDHQDYSDNVCLQQVVLQSLRSVSTQFDSSGPKHFSVPATQYPQYLIGLQRKFEGGLRVRALALVDQRERFWQQDLGREILATTSPESVRVFVFVTPDDLIRNIDLVRAHGSKYHSYVMGYQALARAFQHYTKDFSLIYHDASKLLAFYEERVGQKLITFSSDGHEFSDHEKEFNAIVRFAKKVDGSTSWSPEGLANQVFNATDLVLHPTKDVEMSAYISPEEYDSHEEEHAYYVEMMDRMLAQFESLRGKRDEEIRVLELGAGTGIFTRRLAKTKDVQVSAVELDWACFVRLKHNLYHVKHVTAYHRDSRIFDPGPNEDAFPFVFSSFSDHHIAPQDKPVYLENVKRNMTSGGYFIVGDEFLPRHNITNKLERAEALTRYHNHIIERAEKEGHPVLAKLEREALQSGLDEVGDFKLSCEQFEQFLSGAGFLFAKEKIGPSQPDDIGGIYVYVASLPY